MPFASSQHDLVGNVPSLVGYVEPTAPGADPAAVVVFLALAFGVPALGLVLMATDVRRYLRSLGRALVVVTYAMRPGVPYWARKRRPPCLETLDLELPCTEEQVLAAYRRKVKELHPDKGGSLQKFLQLQRHYEQAMYLARNSPLQGEREAKRRRAKATTANR
ncbi:hypothetical protein [Lacipirellula sp.]|uniref:hypothetical protein n=1 Tax=Lacipirellula sp. TaxID=2691419 RepID=UPI003D13BEB4